MRVLITTLLLACLGSTVAAAEDSAAADIVKTKTPAGHFYSAQLSLDQGFPFSDMVETHAIFRQMKIYLAHLNLDLSDVVTCLVMIDDIAQWGDFNGVYTQYFTTPYPARSAMGADGLALGASLELECIAVRR